ncbi:TRAM domain-containing protein [Niameybacter massiliensis]|uniref:TRAM domain-containing protein n=1 Tax=Holtiella tumoricola TaxID=3018743 RepID=A0AA42IYI4_9FIRM|nr:PIN domain-containing protein [Holtiella tumoricola]MDA3730023.1 TRAM domain-containing protein [Holtiella tumoricola]
MEKIIRFLISGIIAGIASIMVVDLQEKQIIPSNFGDTLQGSLKFLYEYKELIVFIIIFGLMFITIGAFISKKITPKIEAKLAKASMIETLIYIIGFAIGLGIANLIGNPLLTSQSDMMNILWGILLYLALGYIGIYIVHIKKDEIKGWFSKKDNNTLWSAPKILDTSVIIDGRILDIIKTQFIEGKIIIPTFVLDELRHIADSSDKLKRNRGRRGLDILNEMQNLKQPPIEVMDIDFRNIKEVDVKLIKLAEQIHGAVVTNDFNLNKVAQLQKVTVLNINDLSNAVKPVVLPNEEMVITIIKEGKEQEQGIGYLNDGTMIVVENGRKAVGETKTVQVTSVLQTSAGRMIFAKIIK